MKKVFLMGGSGPMIDRISRLNFDNKNCGTIKFQNAHNLSMPINSSNFPFNRALEELMHSRKIMNRAMLLISFKMGRNFFKSYTFKNRFLVQIFSQYRVVDPSSFKTVLKFFFRIHTLLHLIAFILGFFKIPERYFKIILNFHVKEIKVFNELMKTIDANFIILLDNGNSVLYYLMTSMEKNEDVVYTLIIYSWDNPSTKCFVSNFFDLVWTWNQDQINEIKYFSDIPINKMFVLGSQLADSSYNKYTYNVYRSSNFHNRLLFIGMFNKSDEAKTLLKIKDYLDRSNSRYTSVTYRPHPQARSSLKKISSFKLIESGIDVDFSENFDLSEFGGIICLPTSMILQVIVSGIPTILFTPKEKAYRINPNTLIKWYHYKNLKTLNCYTNCSKLEKLLSYLDNGIPELNYKPDEHFARIFPKFESSYEDRIIELIKQV